MELDRLGGSKSLVEAERWITRNDPDGLAILRHSPQAVLAAVIANIAGAEPGSIVEEQITRAIVDFQARVDADVVEANCYVRSFLDGE